MIPLNLKRKKEKKASSISLIVDENKPIVYHLENTLKLLKVLIISLNILRRFNNNLIVII